MIGLNVSFSLRLSHLFAVVVAFDRTEETEGESYQQDVARRKKADGKEGEEGQEKKKKEKKERHRKCGDGSEEDEEV